MDSLRCIQQARLARVGNMFTPLHGFNLQQSSWYTAVPLAATSVGGANSRDLLLNNGQYVIYESSKERLTLKDLISSFMVRLNKAAPRPLHGGRISGYQLMDLVHGATKMKPETINLRPRANWTVLLKTIPCLLGANMGEVIAASRSQAVDSACNHLIADQNFLAAAISAINSISQR